MIFFSHPGKVKAIMEKYKKEKSNFESKISQYKADAIKIDKKIQDQETIIIEAEKKYSQAEKDRLLWKEKYKKLKSSPIKKPDDIKTLREAKIEIKKLIFRLGECNAGIEKTENSLAACNTLKLELEAQKANWIEKYAKLEEKSNYQTLELAIRDQTIQDLKKAIPKINFKKVFIYTAIGIAGIFAFKLIQLLF